MYGSVRSAPRSGVVADINPRIVTRAGLRGQRETKLGLASQGGCRARRWRGDWQTNCCRMRPQGAAAVPDMPNELSCWAGVS